MKLLSGKERSEFAKCRHPRGWEHQERKERRVVDRTFLEFRNICGRRSAQICKERADVHTIWQNMK